MGLYPDDDYISHNSTSDEFVKHPQESKPSQNNFGRYLKKAAVIGSGALMTYHALTLTLGASRPEIATRHDELTHILALEDIVAERVAEGEPKDLYNYNYLNAKNREVTESQLKEIEESKEFSDYNLQKTLRIGYLGAGLLTVAAGFLAVGRKRKDEE